MTRRSCPGIRALHHLNLNPPPPPNPQPSHSDQLASVGDDQALLFWDARTGKLATEVTGVHTQPVTGVSLSPLGGSILSAGRDNLIQLVDVRTFEPRV